MLSMNVSIVSNQARVAHAGERDRAAARLLGALELDRSRLRRPADARDTRGAVAYGPDLAGGRVELSAAGPWWITGLAFSCSACTATESGVQRRSRLVGSASTVRRARSRKGNRGLWARAALHAHSNILPAYHEGPGQPAMHRQRGPGRRIGAAAGEDHLRPGVQRPHLGSGPIMPTMRSARSMVAASSAGAVASGLIFPAASRDLR